jgi:hypothetical protein
MASRSLQGKTFSAIEELIAFHDDAFIIILGSAALPFTFTRRSRNDFKIAKCVIFLMSPSHPASLLNG